MYIPGTSQVVPVDQYYQTIGGGSPVGRNYVYDATNFRLREISLAYTFRNLFGVSKNLTVSANARNLFFLYLDAPIDPRHLAEYAKCSGQCRHLRHAYYKIFRYFS